MERTVESAKLQGGRDSLDYSVIAESAGWQVLCRQNFDVRARRLPDLLYYRPSPTFISCFIV